MAKARSSNLWGKITILLIICCFGMVGLGVDTALALDGSGTQEDPWRIKSLADFNDFAADANYWDDYTRLETDVNLAGPTYTTAVIAPDTDPASGFQGTKFTGVFDGNDHKIMNLTVNDGGSGNDYLGLFGYVDEGEVRNLGLEGGSTSGDWCVGGLAGSNGDWYYPGGTISNCYSTGDVNGDHSVGGLVGLTFYGSISDCYSTGDVNGDSDIGGLVGQNICGIITDCYATGNIIGEGRVGGLAGWHEGYISNCYATANVLGGWAIVGGLVGLNYKGHISYSYATGSVGGDDNVGGLVGQNSSGTIVNCYSNASVSGDSVVSGLVGNNHGKITNCYASGNISGNKEVGGLVGDNSSGTIVNCFANASVSGDSVVSGLVGNNHGKITNCYTTGSVIGVEIVGGLVGSNIQKGHVSNCYSTGSVIGVEIVGGLVGLNIQKGYVSNCYSTGSVSGNHNVGGLAGSNSCNRGGCGTIIKSYWDTETSGEPKICGYKDISAAGCEPNYGKTTDEMHQQSTFQDWDFISVWAIGENQTYPYLRTVPAGDINKDGVVNFFDAAILCEKWMNEE